MVKDFVGILRVLREEDISPNLKANLPKKKPSRDL